MYQARQGAGCHMHQWGCVLVTCAADLSLLCVYDVKSGIDTASYSIAVHQHNQSPVTSLPGVRLVTATTTAQVTPTATRNMDSIRKQTFASRPLPTRKGWTHTE